MYRLSSDQQALVERVAELAETEIAPHASRVDADAVFPREAVDALGAHGYLGLTIAEEAGGLGQGMRTSCAVLEEVAQGCASTAMVYLMHLCGVAAYSHAENEPIELLRRAAKGEHLSTLAFSEFGSRSHFWAPVSQERKENGRIVLNTSKSFVTSAGYADGYVVSTRVADDSSATRSTLYLIEKQDNGIRATAQWNGLGLRGNASGPMVLRNVTVDATRRLSRPGEGLQMMLEVVLPMFNLGIAAVSLGIAEAATRSTQKHIVKARFEHLDMSLAELPNERARLARMRIETDKARAHLNAALDAVEVPGPQTMLMVLESKAVASDAAIQVTDTALRACGGSGFTKALGVERHFRDARAAQVMAPTTDVLHEFIGRALCGMEMFG